MTWRPSTPDNPPEPVALSVALDRVTRNLGGPGTGPLQALFGRWAEIVGDAVADHCRPLSLRDHRLVIGVDEPIWATQLTWLEADLRRRLDEVLGPDVVRTISVNVRRS